MRTLEFLQMESEMFRIQTSILKIKNLDQVASTIKWIGLFEKRFKATDVACNLKERLRNVEL